MNKDPRNNAECLDMLAKSSDLAEQLRLRDFIRQSNDYYTLIFHVYFRNPFLRLLEDEVAFMASDKVAPGLRELLSARAAAARSRAPKYAVFCMPKSGSSFVQSALQHALQLPVVSTISLAPPSLGSHLGINSREQEMDELAVLNATLSSPRGFISQSHTRYSPYLARQLQFYGITPIVTMRNILDCIVSFDDMMMTWRATEARPIWRADPQFALPVDYPALPSSKRYELLASSFGIWLFNFHLSWKRAIEFGAVSPLLIRYEEDILNPDRLVDRISETISLTVEQRERLSDYARKPDKKKARLNVGRAGRGLDHIPESVVSFLMSYAKGFQSEITDAELAVLVR